MNMIASQANPQLIAAAEALLAALEFYPPSETLAALAARLRTVVEQSRSAIADMPPFESQFQLVPDGKVSGGHLEVGEFDGSSEYEWETDIEFLLGPDGKVWAKIGSLDDLPDDDDKETGA
jgi:hypothetical protein